MSKETDAMGRKRFTPEQIIRKLREAEVLLSKGMTIPDPPCGIGRWAFQEAGLPSI